MKFSTEWIVVGRLGRWVAMGGAFVAVVGVILEQLDLLQSLGFAMMSIGSLVVVFGLGFHLMVGDEADIPPAVKSVLDRIDESDEARRR